MNDLEKLSKSNNFLSTFLITAPYFTWVFVNYLIMCCITALYTSYVDQGVDNQACAKVASPHCLSAFCLQGWNHMFWASRCPTWLWLQHTISCCIDYNVNDATHVIYYLIRYLITYYKNIENLAIWCLIKISLNSAVWVKSRKGALRQHHMEARSLAGRQVQQPITTSR